MKTLLMSIKPRFSDLIFSGEKRYELRRRSGRLEAGDLVVVYASSPVKAVVGVFKVGGVASGPVEALWDEFGDEFGVQRNEYVAYFDGLREANAIQVEQPVEVKPVPLSELRERNHRFRPPQSYMYWNENLSDLVGEHAARWLSASGCAAGP